nr:radical SAM protein [Dictyobacter kobayashii]
MCKRIIEAKEAGAISRDLTFICSSRVDHLNRARGEEMLENMKQAGFRMIMLGVESFSERVLKDFNKRITVPEIWKSIQRILDAGIQPLYYVIPFAPTIKLDELIDTIRQSIIALTVGVEVSINTYIWAIPGTPVYESEQHEVMYKDTFVEGANKILRKPHFILPEDPEVKTLAEKFIEHYPSYEQELCQKFGITHMPRRTASLVTFYAMLDLLGDYEQEKGLILEALDDIAHGRFIDRLAYGKKSTQTLISSMKWGSSPWAS